MKGAIFLFASALFAQSPQSTFDQAVRDYQAGRIQESVDGFDKLVKLTPDYAPQLWQRGIALYDAGRYKDCRAQFESHRTVNPADVENAAWHFLCVARAESPEKAKAALLPVGPDSRVPMSEIYRMYRGDLKPEQVLAAAGTSREAQFYAHLYIGLYEEATGHRERALENIGLAADFTGGGYMAAVARVHLGVLRRAK